MNKFITPPSETDDSRPGPTAYANEYRDSLRNSLELNANDAHHMNHHDEHREPGNGIKDQLSFIQKARLKMLQESANIDHLSNDNYQHQQYIQADARNHDQSTLTNGSGLRKRLASLHPDQRSPFNTIIHDRTTILEEPSLESNHGDGMSSNNNNNLNNLPQEKPSENNNRRLQSHQLHHSSSNNHQPNRNHHDNHGQHLSHRSSQKSINSMTNVYEQLPTKVVQNDTDNNNLPKFPSNSKFGQLDSVNISNNNNHQHYLGPFEEQNDNLTIHNQQHQNVVSPTNNFLLATCILLLTIIGLLLSQKWISRWFNDNKGTFKTFKRNVRERFLNQISERTIFSTNGAKNNNNSEPTKQSTADVNNNNDTVLYDLDGNHHDPESIQLVANTTPKRRYQHDKDAIIVDQTISVTSFSNNKDVESNNPKPQHTIISIKNQSNKNSFITTLRQSKPNVSLLGARVRRFIDDEAQELRDRCNRNPDRLSIRDKLLASLLIPLAKKPTSSQNNNDLNVDGDHDNQADKGATNALVPRIDNSGQEYYEHHDDTKCNYETHIIVNELDNKQANAIPCSSGYSDEVKRDQLATNQDNVNRANGLPITTSCAWLDQSIGRYEHSAHLLDGSLDDKRSKSQGHTPNISSQQCCFKMFDGLAPRVGLSTNAQPIDSSNNINRPCYSASPTNMLNISLPVNGAMNGNPCQPMSLCACQMNSQLHSANQSQQQFIYQQQQQQILHNNNIYPSPINSQNHHLKRQYENYYDDEHSDPYHSLTASIGIELADIALSRNNSHQMHNHQHHRMAQYDAKAINDLYTPCQLKAAYQTVTPSGPIMSNCMMAHTTNEANIASHQNQSTINGLMLTKSCCETISPTSMDYRQNNNNHLLGCRQHLDAISFSRCATKGSSNADPSGSAGDILLSSSASTSLGGSDQCFTQFTNCVNPCSSKSSCSNSRSGQLVCGCLHQADENSRNPQRNQYYLPRVQLEPAPLTRPKSPGNSGPSRQQMPSPPMTILVQQPSLTSRSPSPSRLNDNNNNDMNEVANKDKLNKTDSKSLVSQDDEHQSAVPKIPDDILPKTGVQENISHRLSAAHSHLARRTSIAGDRISRAHNSISMDQTNISSDHQISNHNKNKTQSYQHYHGPLVHRASIASSDPQTGLHEIQLQLHQQIHHQHIMQTSAQNFIPTLPEKNQTRINQQQMYQSTQQQQQQPTQHQQSSIGIAEMSPLQQPMMIVDPTQYQYNHPLPQQQHQPYSSSTANNMTTTYEPQYVMGSNYPMYHPVYHHYKGSACSSSAGSTSGLGISGTGSACTNTPTGTMHSFMSNYPGPFSWTHTDSISTPPSSASVGTSYSQFQTLNSNPLGATVQVPSAIQPDALLTKSINQANNTSHPGKIVPSIPPALAAQHHVPRRSINPAHFYPHMKAMQNRKLSLPTHLESQSSNVDYLSHAYQMSHNNNCNNNATLETQSSQARQPQPRGRPSLESRPSMMHMTSDADSIAAQGCGIDARRLSCQRDESSRRSSQTITRQSSFWLEDNSLDSIVSSLDVVAKNLETTSDEAIEATMVDTGDKQIVDGTSATTSETMNNNGVHEKVEFDQDQPIDENQDNTEEEEEEDDDEEDEEDIDDDDDQDDQDDGAKFSKKGARQTNNSKNQPRCLQRNAAAGFGGRIRLARGGVFAKFSSSSSSSNAGVSPSPSPDSSCRSREIIKSRTLKATSRVSSKKAHQQFIQRAIKNNCRTHNPRLGTMDGKSSNPEPSTSCATATSQGENEPSISGSTSTTNRDIVQSATKESCELKNMVDIDESRPTGCESPLLVVKDEDNQPITNPSQGPCDETNSNGSRNHSCEQDSASLDTDFTVPRPPGARLVSTSQNSASLERQCRELWKLRATLHDDSCDADDWSNYHQRLNKRYDSGYKSLEQQLSSSLEGSLLLSQDNAINTLGWPNAPSGLAMVPPSSVANSHSDEPERPRSGCSRLLESPSSTQANHNSSNNKLNLNQSDTLSLVDERELTRLTSNNSRNRHQRHRSPSTGRSRALTPDNDLTAGGRDSKCSILSDSSQLAKLVELDYELELDEGSALERQHLLRSSNTSSRDRLVAADADYQQATIRNSSRSSNEEPNSNTNGFEKQS